MQKIKVLAIIPDKYGSGYFRSLKPHQKLSQLYPEEFQVDIIEQITFGNTPMEELKQYNIIHFSKNLFSDKIDKDNLTEQQNNLYGERIVKHKTILDKYQEGIKKFQEMVKLPNANKQVLNKLKKELDAQRKELISLEKTIPMYGNDSEKIVEELHKFGVKFVLDLDDHWEISFTHPLANRFGYLGYQELALKHLKLADYVTTTTRVFAKELEKYNKNVFILPNSIDSQEEQWIPKPIESDRVRIMWAGGSGHDKDLELVKSLVNKLKLDNVQFVLCGFDLRGVENPTDSAWYKYEKIFTDNYSIVSPEYKEYLHTFDQNKEWTNIDNEPYRRIWTKDISKYGTNYNMADICLAPLENCKFTSMKSQLKIIEAGWFSKPVIASKVSPYTIDIVNAYQKGGNIDTEKGNGFLADTDKDFYKYVKLLINDKELREKLGQNLNKTIKEEFDLDVTTKKRAELYKKLV